jgi:hypothetical protein
MDHLGEKIVVSVVCHVVPPAFMTEGNHFDLQIYHSVTPARHPISLMQHQAEQADAVLLEVYSCNGGPACLL